MSDFERYTGFKVKVQAKKVSIPNKGHASSEILFHHADDLAGVLQNNNFGWYYIEQAEEFDSGEVFDKLDGRLRRILTPNREIQDKLIAMGLLTEFVEDFNTLDKSIINDLEEAIITKLNLPFRQGVIVANTNGHNWVWRKFKNAGGEEYLCDKEFKLDNYNFGRYASLHEAKSFDNKKNIPASTLASWQIKKDTEPASYRRFVENSWEEADCADKICIYSRLLEAVNRQVKPEYGEPIVVSCDPADENTSGKGDKTAIYVFHGYKVLARKILDGKSPMETCGHIITMMKEHNADFCVIDDIGVGAGIKSRLREMEVSTMGINSGRSALDPIRFVRLRDQLWKEAGDLINNGECSIQSGDEKLIEDLAHASYTLTSKGQFMVEKKDKMREALGRSPDNGDAFIMGVWGVKHGTGYMQRGLAAMNSTGEYSDSYDPLTYGL